MLAATRRDREGAGEKKDKEASLKAKTNRNIGKKQEGVL